MLLVEKMDEGPLLAQAPYALPAGVTTPQLSDALIEISYQALVVALPRYMDGSIVAMPQDTNKTATYSRKLNKADAILDWHKPAVTLEREIRAFQPWPKSRTGINGLDIVITAADVLDTSGTPGTTAIINKQPVIYCGTGALALCKLKPAGKQEMTGEGFLAGYKQQFLGAPEK
jgi:methionyl-tRNA formyltransferase